MKIAFFTLGCKVNQYETELLQERFEKSGYDIVDFNTIADIYVINSCSVTNMSDRKSRQMASHAKHLNNNAIVVMTGCYVEGIKEIKGLNNIDVIVGNNEKQNIVDIVDNYIKKNHNDGIKLEIFGKDINKEKRYIQTANLIKGREVRENVKIEDGCDNFCSYCIIPYLRGRVRSRNINDILTEVESLANHGVKEIVLVGIEIASYGKDLENISLIDVAEAISNVEGIERLKLSSLEPRWITAENVNRLKNIKKLCPHFHLSLQSGSDGVLKRMNRKYTTDDFEKSVVLLKNSFKDLALTTDIIVGFPGETEIEFKETYDFIEKIGFKEIHVFKYSRRRYTIADKMDDQIDGNIKIERSKLLLGLSKKLNEEYISKYIGKKLDVLYECEHDEYLEGYTNNYIKVRRKKGAERCQELGKVENVIVNMEDLNYNL